MKYLKLYNNSEEAIMNDGETNIFVINGSNGVGMDTPSFLNVEFGFANNTNICSLEFLSGACTNILVEGQHFSKQDLIDSAEDDIISLPSEYLHHNVNVSFQIKNHVMGEDDIYDNALHINGTPNSLYSVNLNNHVNLLSVSVPKGTKEITDMSSCDALTSVTFNDDDIILNEDAFWSCSNLEEIALPIKIKEIPNNLFRGCSSLYYINEFQLKNVETIGERAFYHCRNLVLDLDGFTSLKVISGEAFERCYSLEKWRLPSSLERLPNEGFGEKNSLSEIVLNGTITELQDRCLSNLSAITELYIPDNVQRISIGAFDNDSNLTYIKIDGTPIFDDSMYSATTNMPLSGQLDCNVETYLNFTPFLPYGWSNCIVYINNDGSSGVTYYKNDINTDVINVYWPSGVEKIPNDKFHDCLSLSSITLPSGLTSIGNSAFTHCSSLINMTIPNNVTSIGESVFRLCLSLSSITLPSGLTSIGNSAFYNCTGLTSITIPEGITNIGESVFCFCLGLSSITIPNSVTTIGRSAFEDCVSLSSITIPNSVTSIGEWAFDGCESSSSITLPSSLTSISKGAFRGCYSLSSITLPSGVTTIDNYAFEYCYSLSSITLPNSVTSIGNSAFESCRKLHEIIYHGSNIISIGNNSFLSISNTGTLICENTDAANNILQYLPSGWDVLTHQVTF